MKRNQKIIIENGKGFLDITGDYFDCILSWEGIPLVITWNDCVGSIGQYFLRSGVDKFSISEKLKEVRLYLENGIPEYLNLSDAIFPLIELFSNGDYKLVLSEKFERLEIVDYDKPPKYKEEYYPYNTIIALQRLNSLNSERIKYFENIIKKGKKPVLITFSLMDNSNEFIIDGHHKAYAYKNLGIMPQILHIMKFDNSKIEIETGRNLVKSISPDSEKNYNELKSRVLKRGF